MRAPTSTLARRPTPRPPLTPHQCALLRAETLCALETIRAWWTGAHAVREATAIRLDAGARKLGLIDACDGTR